MLKPIVVLAALTIDYVLAQAPGAEQYVVPAKFPSSIFKSYYVPASPTQNPQPAIHDPVLDIVRLRGGGDDALVCYITLTTCFRLTRLT